MFVRFVLALMTLSLAQGQSAQASSCEATHSKIPDSVVGIQIFYPDDPRSWRVIKGSGVSWVRMEFRWDYIEPQQGRYDWSYADRITTFAHENNVRILGLINHVPQWAADDQKLPVYAASFAQEIITRYGAKAGKRGIDVWEVFNEPNLPGYGWPDLDVNVQENAALYAAVIAAVNKQVRTNHADAILASAGLSPDGQPPEDFLRELYKHDVVHCFDVLAIHPYGFTGRLKNAADNVRALLNQWGEVAPPVWITEYGTASDKERANSINAAFDEMPTLEAFFWFNERDIGRLNDTYGLVDYEYRAKPDFTLFKDRLAGLQKNNLAVHTMKPLINCRYLICEKFINMTCGCHLIVGK